MKEQVYHIPTMEKRFIIEALKRSKGNKKEAADMLGINTRTLLRKRNQYNVSLDNYYSNNN